MRDAAASSRNQSNRKAIAPRQARGAAGGRPGRRAVIAAAEGDARDVELRAAMRFQILAGAPARGVAARRVVLDFGRRRVQAERIGEALGVRRIPEGKRPALGLVALEPPRRGLAL